jgi:hypothetical protein
MLVYCKSFTDNEYKQYACVYVRWPQSRRRKKGNQQQQTKCLRPLNMYNKHVTNISIC